MVVWEVFSTLKQVDASDGAKLMSGLERGGARIRGLDNFPKTINYRGNFI